MPASNRATNFQLYGNPAVDIAIGQRIERTSTRRAAARTIARPTSGIIDDVPAVWLYEIRNYMAVNGA